MEKKDVFEEVRGIIEPGAGIKLPTKIIYDKKQKQFSIKIPKKIADKAEIDVNKHQFLFEVKLVKDPEGNIIRKLNGQLVKKDD